MTAIQCCEAVECCACGSRECSRLGSFEHWGNRLGSVQCVGCGLIRISPRLTEESIANIFSNHYFGSETTETWGYRRIPIFAEVSWLLRLCDARKVFDVGAAHGEFLRFLSRCGLPVDGLVLGGCDVSETAVATSTIPIYRGHLSGVAPTGYDAVTILDTLYYCSDPLRELRAARAAAPWLILRLRTNRNAVKVAKSNRHPAAADHLWAFTPATAACLVARAGFTDVRIMPASYAYRPGALLLNAFVRVGQVLNLPILTHSFLVFARRM